MKITKGVKQGDVLYPQLFKFFINGLLKTCTSLKIGCWIGIINTFIQFCLNAAKNIGNWKKNESRDFYLKGIKVKKVYSLA